MSHVQYWSTVVLPRTSTRTPQSARMNNCYNYAYAYPSKQVLVLEHHLVQVLVLQYFDSYQHQFKTRNHEQTLKCRVE